MFLFNWIWNIFAYFGFKKNAKLLIIGLDNAGKSLLLDMISSGPLVQHPPSFHGRVQTLDLGRLRFSDHDLGGGPAVRRVWKDPAVDVDGVIFMVDAADELRFEEAREELNSLIKCDTLPDVPIAVLFNKSDLSKAVGEEYLVDKLTIQMHRTGKEHVPRETIGQRPLETFPTSLLKRTGYVDALRWLVYYIE